MSRWGYTALALVLATFAGSAYTQFAYADQLPDKVPIHWNIHGEPDGWVSKDQTFMVFYLMPTMMAGMVALGLFVLPWLSPRNFAVEEFRRTYDFVFFLVALLFSWVHGVILSGSLTGPLAGHWLIAGIFLFFALIGNVLGKVKSNFWMGVRTPWTLADPQVWTQTHRVAAWTFVAVGIIGFVAVLSGVPPIWCFVLLIAGALWPVVYSLVLYKRLERQGRLDAQRQESASGVASAPRGLP